MGAKDASVGFSLVILISGLAFGIYKVYQLITGELLLSAGYYILIVVLSVICLFILYKVLELIGTTTMSYLIRRKER